MRPPNLGDNWYTGHPSRLMKKKKQLTEAWRKREISNFEYLMELNTIAGMYWTHAMCDCELDRFSSDQDGLIMIWASTRYSHGL